jgi:hypothetical protein
MFRLCCDPFFNVLTNFSISLFHSRLSCHPVTLFLCPKSASSLPLFLQNIQLKKYLEKIILCVSGIVAFILRNIKPLFFVSSLTLSKPLNSPKFKARACHLGSARICRHTRACFPACGFVFALARSSLRKGHIPGTLCSI